MTIDECRVEQRVRLTKAGRTVFSKLSDRQALGTVTAKVQNLRDAEFVRVRRDGQEASELWHPKWWEPL